MYLGEVNVAQSQLASLIKTAECLKVKGLAIPDQDPTQTTTNKSHVRKTSSNEYREFSPPSKKRRSINDDKHQADTSNSATSCNQSSTSHNRHSPSSRTGNL